MTVSDPLPHSGGLLTRITRLRFTADEDHFKAGNLVIKCQASLAPPNFLSHHRGYIAAGFKNYGKEIIRNRTGDDIQEADKRVGAPGENNYGLRTKLSFRRKLKEAQQTAMMHFFNTLETTVSGGYRYTILRMAVKKT